MKKLVAGIIIAIIGCVLALSANAQPRDDGRRGRGRGIAEQSRSYRGRQQRRRYHGGRYEWYEDPSVGRAIGGLLGGWLRGQQEQAERPDREPVRDVAWCINRYHSYNPKTGQYLGYDGKYHDCP